MRAEKGVSGQTIYAENLILNFQIHYNVISTYPSILTYVPMNIYIVLLPFFRLHRKMVTVTVFFWPLLYFPPLSSA